MAMDGKVSRISVDGLRHSDHTVLSVMIQDIVNKPIDKLSIPTLCDLVAVSELDGLSKMLARDLGRFREKMVREFNDIPSGAMLNDHLERLSTLPADQVPAFWREAILARRESSELDKRSAEQLAELADNFEQTPAADVTIAEKPTVRVQHGPQKGPAANSGLQKRMATPAASTRKRASSGSGGSTAAKTPRTPAKVRDPERAKWIRDDVLDRLSNYGSRGLKQTMLIIGARKRAPWSDLGQDEIVAVLRSLEKDNRVRLSAGRWSIRGRAW